MSSIFALLVIAVCAEKRAQQKAAGSEVDHQTGSVLEAPYDPARQISEYIIAMHQDRKGRIWFGTISDGVCRYDWQTVTCFTGKDGCIGRGPREIVEDDAGNLWFGTDRGVCRFDGRSFTAFTVDHGLIHNDVQALAMDRSGNLWIGTFGGVSRYDGRTFSSVQLPIAAVLSKDYPTGMRSRELVWSIIEDRHGHLWFGTNGSGVIRYDGSGFTRLTSAQGLSDDFVYTMLEDRRGMLWFGTNGGLSRYDGTAFTTFSRKDGLSSDAVFSMIEDRRGGLWLGTAGGGASRFDGKSFMTISASQGLGNPHVQSLLEDSSGRIWFGTSGGVFRFDKGRATNFTRDSAGM